ncbi:MAG: tRNA dihydrouridine synthase DusB [Limnochordales bacterium]|nr:tRNA dihydrouridine synthase DusB [Limnochordales bacterium]
MAGATDSVFRRLAREAGAGLVCGELISARALVMNNRRTERYLRIDPAEHPVSLQLFGSDPEVMAEAAEKVAAAGADIIDVNLGCPVPKVIGGGDGCALMLNPDLVGRIVEAMVRAVSPVPVTVKMRRGWDAAHENAVEVAQAAAAAGAAAIAVHGRFRHQHHQGPVDLGVIAAVRAAVSVPVIGNGGISSPADAVRMVRETGCDAVMVGQAALGNPWLLGEIAAVLSGRPVPPPPTQRERVEMAIRHLQAFIALEGEKALPAMRKHLAWYIKGIPGAARIRDQINHMERSDEVIRLLRQYQEALSD